MKETLNKKYKQGNHKLKFIETDTDMENFPASILRGSSQLFALPVNFGIILH